MKKDFRLTVKGIVYDLRTFKDMETVIIDRKFSIDFNDMEEYKKKFHEQLSYAMAARTRNDVKGDYHVSLNYKNYISEIVMKPCIFKDNFYMDLHLRSIELVRNSEAKLDKIAAELPDIMYRSLHGK